MTCLIKHPCVSLVVTWFPGIRPSGEFYSPRKRTRKINKTSFPSVGLRWATMNYCGIEFACVSIAGTFVIQREQISVERKKTTHERNPSFWHIIKDQVQYRFKNVQQWGSVCFQILF